MITKFDKNGKAEHYKKLFAESLKDEDYELALERLIKYSEEKDCPDFHLACGMLYMLMTQDSDDPELVYLAYREFMMHIIRFPSCERAYRDLLASEFLRRDMPDTESYGAWMEKRGINFRSVMNEIADAGFLSFGDDPIDFYGFFKSGEFGDIDPESDVPEMSLKRFDMCDYSRLMSEPQDPACFEREDGSINRAYEAFLNGVDKSALEKYNREKNKIISFCGASSGDVPSSSGHARVTSIADARKEFKNAQSEYMYFDDDGEDDEDDAELMDRLFDSLKSICGASDGDDYNDDDYADKQNASGGSRKDDMAPDSDELMRLAEARYEHRDYTDAMRILDKVSRTDEKYYYVLALRALIYMESGKFSDAERTLDEATRLHPNDALCGTLLCQLYEFIDKTDRIPPLLKSIDVKTFMNGDHVYKAFRLASKYCSADDALDLTEDYINEYNLLDMRLLYAQMLYNNGEKEEAINELYYLSRIFYDDINVNYFYYLAKSGAEKMPVEEEAPQSVLSAVVDNFLAAVDHINELDEEMLESDLITLGSEFFITLEFRNERRMLKRMFDAVRKMTASAALGQKMRDALVSPYAEPIVKATILSEILERDRDTDFLLELNGMPISPENVRRPAKLHTAGALRAYAFVLALCGAEALDGYVSVAEKFESDTEGMSIPAADAAYYLLKKTAEPRGVEVEGRCVYALGFNAQTSAGKALSSLSAIMKKVNKQKGE